MCGENLFSLVVRLLNHCVSHKCSECGFASARKSQLMEHIEGVHDKIKKFVCTECGYAASRIYNLMKHTDAVYQIMHPTWSSNKRRISRSKHVITFMRSL